ncbi:MAG: ABC transporter ATP-binding protein [Treponema sp.]|nr:ABC transporter ATP-binding protein [Treponema sp.]
MKAVIAEGLTKAYAGDKLALNRASFSINEGGIFGFLGPNGAGKTTAVKLLNGMLCATEGSCSVFGIDPWREPEKAHALCGVVTEKAQMYNNLTGLQNLVFFGELFGVAASESARRAVEILARLDLIDAKDGKLSTYSTGMRQRLSLARAMIHRPKVLFLDEPTSGLDPESAQNVNNMIKELARDLGTTVFLCTHQLRYAEEVCSEYGLISEGSLLALGSLDDLRAQVSSGITVTIRAANLRAFSPPAGLPFRREGELAHWDVASREEIPALVKSIVEGGGKVYEVTARKPSLEEIYFALIEKRKGSQ